MSLRAQVMIYRLMLHGLVLAGLWHELAELPDGNAMVSIAWAAYALAILLAGLRLPGTAYIYTGIGTLRLVTAKLLLVDLVALEPVWRILLFLGFGGIFLVISYHLQSWLRRRPDA